MRLRTQVSRSAACGPGAMTAQTATTSSDNNQKASVHGSWADAFAVDALCVASPLLRPASPEPGPMLLENALVHHHQDSRLAGLLGGFLVDHAFLQLDDGNLEADGFV